jgi:hypothetical protein
MRTFIALPLAAVAGLMSALLATTGPATAKNIVLNACQKKHSQCSERCIIRYDGPQIGDCIKRTCDKQNPGCGGDSLGSKGGGKRTDTAGTASTNPKPPKIGMPGGGGGVIAQPTSSIGTGTRPPLASSGIKQTWGAAPGGSTFRSGGRK